MQKYNLSIFGVSEKENRDQRWAKNNFKNIKEFNKV